MNQHNPLLMVDRALALAAMGFEVFPLGPNGKKPIIRDFPNKATTNPDQIRKWWRNGPTRNIGVYAGRYKGLALYIIDVDDKDGRTGSETILALELQGFEIVSTFTVRTASGGLHYYYVVDVPMKQGVDVFGSGVDTRSKGGYVVAPGSVVNGKLYTIEDARLPVGLPDWMRSYTKAAPEGPGKGGEKCEGIDPDRARQRGEEWLKNFAEAGTAGSRNDTAFRVAAKLRDFGCEPEVILELMVEHWDCEPAAPAEDLERIIANVFRYARGAQGSDDPGAAFYDEVAKRAQEEAARKAADEAAGCGSGSGGGDCGGSDAGGSARGADEPGGDEWDKATAEGKREEANERRKKYFFDGDAPPAPPKQLIKRLLNSTGVAIVGGQSGAGKTFIVLDMAVALASGQSFFGHKVKERAGVCIVAFEGAGSIHLRIGAARKARGIEGTLPIIWTRGETDLRSKEAMANLAEDIKVFDAEMQERFGVRLGTIVIDTLGRAFSMKDENDNAEANAIIGALDQLSVVTGAAVVAVHDYGKNEAVGLRGASAWRGGADTVLSVLADRNETTGSVSNRRIALAKSRDDEEGQLSGFDLVEVSVGVDEDLETIKTCRVEPRVARREQGDIEVPLDKARECLEALRGKDHRYDKQAPAWAGRIIARVLAIDLGIDGAKRRVEKIIDRWIAKGSLETFISPDANRKDKIYVRVVGDFDA